MKYGWKCFLFAYIVAMWLGVIAGFTQPSIMKDLLILLAGFSFGAGWGIMFYEDMQCKHSQKKP